MNGYFEAVVGKPVFDSSSSWFDKLKGSHMINEMTSSQHRFSAVLIHRIRYHYGFPFIMSAVLAVVTAALPRFGGPTSIWTFALLALIATSFSLLCGGRFRTFYIVLAVTPPFLFVLVWFFRLRSAMPDLPSRGVTQYFLYFVAAPILLVWFVARLSGRKEQNA